MGLEGRLRLTAMTPRASLQSDAKNSTDASREGRRGKKFFCFNFRGEGNGMGLNWDGKEHIHPSILVEMVGKGV